MLHLKTNRREVAIFSIAIAAFLGCLGWGRWDVATKRAPLQAKGDLLRNDLVKGHEADELSTLVEVESGKSSYFFGSEWGVIRIYLCRKSDAAMDSFTGLEYFFRYTPDGWTESDTARIELPEHIYEGYKKLENAGHRVEASAYERYKN